MTKILLIGEIRGTTEEEYDFGFTGSSGIELMHMLRDSGLGPNVSILCEKCQTLGEYPTCQICKQSLYPSPQDMISYWHQVKRDFDFEITNVFDFHPPDNDLGHIFSPESKSSFMPGLKYHLKRPISYVKPEYHKNVEALWQRIKDTQPNLCLLLGNIASWAILKKVKITEIRGYISESPITLTKCLPTLHPANILRNYPDRPLVIADFHKARRECEYPEIRFKRRKIIYHANIQDLENWFSLPANRYTVDIESGYALFTDIELKNMSPNMRYNLSSQISMVGFERDKGLDAIVVEFMTRNSNDLSYWQSREDEIHAWQIVKNALGTSIPKTFQNGMYDITRLLYYGIKTRNAKDDTMLLHHALFPELKKGLGFLGSIYSDTPEWKSMYAKGENLKRDE